MFFFKRGGEQTTELFKHDTYTIYTFAIDIYIYIEGTCEIQKLYRILCIQNIVI